MLEFERILLYFINTMIFLIPILRSQDCFFLFNGLSLNSDLTHALHYYGDLFFNNKVYIQYGR
jgi:hypothetical protein